MNIIANRRRTVGLALLILTSVGCGAENGSIALDAAVDAAAVADVAADAPPVPPDAAAMALDAPTAEAQPTQELTPEVAFAEIAGTYKAKAANISGSAAPKFDAGAPYGFTIDAGGTITVTTKSTPEVFVWSQHGRKIERNTKNMITAITLQDANERVLVVTYRPSSGPLDVAGAYYEPQGAWYLTEINKQ